VLDAYKDRAVALLADVGLRRICQSHRGRIAYGRKRALELATTIALDPEMLLLDEPTAGMGHEDIDRIAALIKSVAANRTVLMVEHNSERRLEPLDASRCSRAAACLPKAITKPSRITRVREAYMGVGHA
jgi:branched-chain amino acid transport system ATP-binding protein